MSAFQRVVKVMVAFVSGVVQMIFYDVLLGSYEH